MYILKKEILLLDGMQLELIDNIDEKVEQIKSIIGDKIK